MSSVISSQDLKKFECSSNVIEGTIWGLQAVVHAKAGVILGVGTVAANLFVATTSVAAAASEANPGTVVAGIVALPVITGLGFYLTKAEFSISYKSFQHATHIFGNAFGG